MIEVEIALMEAFHSRIVEALPLRDEECNCELADDVPAIATDKYVAILAGGISPGPRHRSSGGVWDLLVSINVAVYERIADVAGDRKRNVYMQRLTSINRLLADVIAVVDFDYDLISLADSKLSGNAADGSFPEPFRSWTIDHRPRVVGVAPYRAAKMRSSAGEGNYALTRSVSFSGCRFMKSRT